MTIASSIGVNQSAATVVRWLMSRNIKMLPMINGQSVGVHSQSDVSTKRPPLSCRRGALDLELAGLDGSSFWG